MKQLSREARKALEDKTPLTAGLRFQPQGFPRDSWRMEGVSHPSTWSRDHWSYDKGQVVKRPSKARPKLTALEQALKQLEKLTKGTK